MALSKDDFMAHASSDDSDNESGYDSEAAEVSKSAERAGGGRAAKRRKLSHSSDSEDDDDDDSQEEIASKRKLSLKFQRQAHDLDRGDRSDVADEEEQHDVVATGKKTVPSPAITKPSTKQTSNLPAIHNGPDELTIPSSALPKTKKDKDPPRPGVIYLSSLPPYLRPSALRNLLSQRGFAPITRLFLAPASKTKAGSTKTSSTTSSSSRQLYSEGWLEFASHKTAKKCAQTLNATPVGGKKGGYYRDDLWNMRYLRGMRWAELMEGVRGERREEEARRDEERRSLAKEQKAFLEGVERGKKWEGMEAKRKGKKRRAGDDGEITAAAAAKLEGNSGEEEEAPRRTWRQFEVQKGQKAMGHDVSEEAKEVLGKIF